MEIVQLSLLLLVFVALAVAMFLRKIPALLALPIMAFLIPIISGVSVADTLQLVLGQGTLRLAEAYTIAIFGSMLSILLQKTGIAEGFIKIGAELSGDKPFIITLIMLILIILLFTTLGGLGAIIMVSTIVLPILASVGVGPVTIVGVFLFGISIGGILNVGNWALYTTVLSLPIDTVRPFAMVMFLLTFVTAILYITIQLYRDGHDIRFGKIVLYSLIFLVIIGMLYFAYSGLSPYKKWQFGLLIKGVGLYMKYAIGAGILLLFALSVLRLFAKRDEGKRNWISFFTPVVPLFLILLFDMNFIAAFICGLIYGFLSTYRKGSLNIFTRSILEGGGVVMPAVALMLGIGMLLNAVMGPSNLSSTAYSTGWPVLLLLKPVLAEIVPSNGFVYILLFTACAPLALYRGPLNVWGMGYGIAAIFLASGMNPGAIMGLLMAVGQIQGISDPTNTQNVWLANEVQIDVQKILWNTIVYTWGIALVGLVISSLFFY